jgi:hypothetical protein
MSSCLPAIDGSCITPQFEQQWREVLSADLCCNKDCWGCGFDLEVGDGFLISQFFVGSGGG